MIGWLRRLLPLPGPALADAAPRDAADIAALHAQAFHRGWSDEEVAGLLRDRAVTADRAGMRGRLAGFILSRRAADEAEILSVAVSAAYRRHGLGRELLTRHLRRLAGQGVRSVFLEVAEKNRAARRLYQTAGFREVGRRANYYPGEGDALILRRDLH